MFAFRILSFALAILMAGPTQSTEDVPPILSKTPLTKDQIAIYRTFLDNYSGAPAPLHLANRTEALVQPDGKDDGDPDVPACVKGLTGEIGVVHILDQSVATPGRVVLVDEDRQKANVIANDPSKTMKEGKSAQEAVDKAFSAGILSLSEIAFDKHHRKAAMSFTFACGRLCGHGAILVFKKTGDRWKISKKPCVVSIS
jgi:hypothetical protein